VKIASRENRRISCEINILHDNVISEFVYAGKIYNFSKQGLYFESDEQITPGGEISIIIKKLPKKNNDYAEITFDVETLWCRELKKSPFRYGYGVRLTNQNASLIKLFDTVEFKEIEFNNDDGQAEADEKDPRAHARKIYNRKLKLKYDSHIWEGLVTNISRGGAFIESKNKFPFDAEITLIVPGKKNRKDVRIKGWILRIDEKGIGVKFNLRSGWKRRDGLNRRDRVTL
jgi:Tfp pilus assembly protein PilZ